MPEPGTYRVILKPGPPATPAGGAASAKAAQISTTELADVRAAANNWRTGLLAMLGLVTTVLVVKGRESFEDLGLTAQILAGAALGLALLLAAVGSWQAMRAAYGDPRPRLVDESILTWDRLDAIAAVNSLRAARLLFFGALAFVVVAVAITSYWPASGGAKVRADANGQRVCGTLVSADRRSIVIKEDGSPKSLQMRDLRSLAVVDTCP